MGCRASRAHDRIHAVLAVHARSRERSMRSADRPSGARGTHVPGPRRVAQQALPRAAMERNVGREPCTIRLVLNSRGPDDDDWYQYNTGEIQ